MKTSRLVLLAVGLTALALLGFALYLQHVRDMLPCPFCVIQRYAFAAIALICFVFAALPQGAVKVGAWLGTLTAIAGAGVAGRHLWIKANPATSCGIDPLETSLNTIPTAKLMPFLFQAEGLCSDKYPPILGLSIPMWSFIWFAVFTFALLWVALRRTKKKTWF